MVDAQRTAVKTGLLPARSTARASIETIVQLSRAERNAHVRCIELQRSPKPAVPPTSSNCQAFASTASPSMITMTCAAFAHLRISNSNTFE